MANLSCFSTLLFSLLFIVKNTSSARNLENPSSNHHHHHDHHHKISFSMPDLLNISHPTTSTLNTPIPFSKPIGFFPPHKGIPIQEPVPKIPGSDSSVQTLSGSNLGMFFPARATLQELEFGAVVTIDANLFDGGIGTNGSPLGKAQGVYVASSEGETSHMMAMTTVFADGGFKDGLRFFGLHRRDVSESHIAVIGGMGKYVGANGYATVKGVELRPNSAMAMKQGHKLGDKPCSSHLFFAILLVFVFIASFADAAIHFHQFVIEAKPVKRLCRTHSTITVNGQFPGPTLEVRDGDTLVITAINRARYNATLHWHGLRQLRNPWADGPEYVTQCPIQPGRSYTYRFTIQNQEGTLWWHAHSRWLRATVYGAIIIYPKMGRPYPFLMPKKEIPILLGEWWDRNPMDVLRQALFTGAAPNVSDAFTINGQPGDLYRCSSKETAVFPVEAGETILLRIINSALNQELFYGVANHKLTVVAVDASYTKPFTTNVIMIAPGQTTDVLITADQQPARYYMAAHAYNSANAPFDNTTTTAILEYKSAPCGAKKGQPLKPIFPQLPGFNDTATATAFTAQLRSPYKAEVPMKIDESLLFTVGLGLINCTNPNSPRCQGPNGTRFAASINNVSFVFPRRNSLMQAYYQGQPGIFTTDFPPVPPIQFDYTGNVSRGLWQPVKATKLFKLRYRSKVQIVFQGTSIVTVENHPMHLHGYEFYVIGSGFGNFNPGTDPAKFNLIDPPRRNTIGTPPGGWVAIRFEADNPGIWLLHCHIDTHLPWGLAMAFLVENGVGELQTVQPPPLDLPQC